MALLVGFIGCALHWDLKFAKKKDPINTENVIKMLNKLGATDIEVHEECVFFRLGRSMYIMDCINEPNVRLGNMHILEDCYDLDDARMVAKDFNNVYLNATVLIDDDRMCFLSSLVFAHDMETLMNAIPMMTEYMETSASYFYHLINQKHYNLGN